VFYNPVPNLDADRREIAYGIGACLFLPRELWNELGGFPEWFGSMAEDMYLCCLARLRGLPVEVTPASGYRHRQGKSFGGNRVEAGRLSTTYRRRFLSERNKTAVMVICTPGWLVWPLLILHFSSLAAEGTVFTTLKKDPQLWRQIYGPVLSYILSGLGGLRAHRKQSQSTRRTSVRAYFRAFVAMPRKFVLLQRHGLPNVR
jgi:GT2 family glycosyltransferase